MNKNKHIHISKYKLKNDKHYLIEPRKSINTSIRCDILNEIKDTSKKTKIPVSKMLDVALLLVLNDDDTKMKFVNILKEY